MSEIIRKALEVGTDVQAFDQVLQDLADASLVQGDILYYDGTNLVRLAPGTNGHFLKTQGAGANPTWAAGDGTGDMLAATYDAAGIAAQLAAATGWVPSGETWTYASATTFTVPGDLTTKYYAGMKIKLTQTTGKFFIITKVAHSGGTTTVTIYGGTDYTLANAAITSPNWSVAKAPAGFPMDPTKWTITTTNSTERTTSSTSLASLTDTLAVPIGAWEISLQGQITLTLGGSTTRTGQLTLSSDGSTETDTDLTARVSRSLDSSGSIAFPMRVQKSAILAADTTYTLMGKVGNAAHAVLISASTFDGGAKFLKARSLYL